MNNNIILEKKQKIPKLIHFIWIGDESQNPLRLDSFKKYAPDYEIKIWKEDELLKLDHPLIDYMKKMPHVTVKTDIARCAILDLFGGIYLDCNIRLVRPMDEMLVYDSSLIWEDKDNAKNMIVSGIIFACEKSKFIEHVVKCSLMNDIDKVINQVGGYDKWWISFGPLMLTYAWNTYQPSEDIFVFPDWHLNSSHHNHKKDFKPGYIFYEQPNPKYAKKQSLKF